MNHWQRHGSLALMTAGLAFFAAGCAPSTTNEPQGPETPVVEERQEADRQVAEAEQKVISERRAQPQAELAQRVMSDLAVSGAQTFSSQPAPPPMAMPQRQADRPVDRENYAEIDTNPVHRVVETPVSTFSIDVDTGSYSNIRRMLREGRLPPEDAVRVEEMINYFSYDYPVPEAGGAPFSVTVEQATTPWNANTRLLQIGLQGYRPDPGSIPASNLVFLLDVSGSMNSPDKLPLLVNSMKMLTRELDEDDRVAIVVYAGASGLVLESTPGNEHATISAALDRLSAGGSTNGGAGIELAYAQARQGFIEGGVNRVILATDGDFNVGQVDFDSLIDLVERQRESGVALTTLGFGTGNYNDHLMEQLADAGNGQHAYIDSLNEARKVLVDELSSTLMMIAKDVKIQIEFNPALVSEYRLIGYENRMLAREDFNNDAVDAGDIGAGHTVTALYEIALVGSGGERVDPLRYQTESTGGDPSGELAFLRLRYKAPDGDTSRLIEQAIRPEDGGMSERLAFAAAVSAFGQHLRGGQYLEGYSLDEILALATPARGEDPFGYRGEFLQLVRLADSVGMAQRGEK
ncbi:vWA domain-containing protein [Wenzhouxiangella marina]|uniref:von Willebrand factor type A n=1 Tax=Wenzhouxiangella marina TaxID=1579979 RepID=A0A0K0XRW5_9GAMM|nr:VWA domain-containing protein [Wenzhouxiangella marina]AKS40454.1 von Willebrand factor type A [Wenzhouxiangella marina]MBB6088224.1 Ca-activated chloride channel family protein [Wenzhouxiangella marina]